MSQKIIRPEGMELVEYLNDGYAICNKCGAVMDRREDPNGGGDIPPAGCRACGGPYPHCKTSCKLFDD